MHIIEIPFQQNNEPTIAITRQLFIKKSNLILFLLELALILNCVIGDYVIFKSDKIKNNLKNLLNLNEIYVNALLDNSSHAIIGFISWLIITFPTFNLQDLILCTCVASFIDLDHFISAKSLHLSQAISLDKRPFLHNSLTMSLANLVLLIILYNFNNKKCYLSILLFNAWFLHHVRDANRHGLWFGSWYTTKSLSNHLYIFISYYCGDSFKEMILSEPVPNSDAEFWRGKSDEEYGQFLLRTNYARTKPYSKYTQEGLRPRSPNPQYTELTNEAKEKLTQNSNPFFQETTRLAKQTRPRYFLERHADCMNQHLIRGQSASQPYCFIMKDALNHDTPEEYQSSEYGAYPPWGPSTTGFRTTSHYNGEPVERFVNIDMYKRPAVNQPGKLVFDYGRPNNGYYLQRHQYSNTWFNSNCKLNQTDVLRSIEPKTIHQHNDVNNHKKILIRAKSQIWPNSSEYEHRFEGKQDQKEFE